MITKLFLIKSGITVQLCHPAKRAIYLWSRANFNIIRQSILSLCEEFTSTYSVITHINILWNNFLDICNQCLNLIPTKMSSSKFHQPWITSHIKQLTHKKQWAYDRAHLTNHANDWSSYYNVKKLSQQECCNAFNKYVSSFINLRIIPLQRNSGPLLTVDLESKIKLVLVH